MSTFAGIAFAVTVLSMAPPPNKGAVSWSMGGFGSVDTVEVGTSPQVADPLTGQVWTRVPSWLHWSTAHLVRGGSEGSELRLECPDGPSPLPCTFWIVLYSCVPCSTASNGGLPGTLTSAGWGAGSCGPRYAPFGGEEYPTATFRYEMAAGEPAVLLPLRRDAMHLVVFEMSRGQQCSLVEGPEMCGERPGCVYGDDGLCKNKPLCQRPSGPQRDGSGPPCACIEPPMQH